MTELKLRVRGLDDFFAGARQAARRLDRGDFAPQTPSVSFASIAQMFATLTPNRWTLGKLCEIGPSSIRGLAKALARDYRGACIPMSRGSWKLG